MAKAKAKTKGFTPDEKALLKKKDIDPRFWEPIHQRDTSMIIKNRFTGEVKMVYKK
ncbi:MAG: hypothetical protein IJ448_01335 [Oscillospiraceae bacterium]|nr:hypothetical protein [Oscillospiraceae bacterium]